MTTEIKKTSVCKTRNIMHSLFLLLLLMTNWSVLLAKTTVDEKSSEDKPVWLAIVMVGDVMQTTNEIGGEWIPMEKLALSDKPDLYYNGFIFSSVNAVAIHQKEILEKFVKDDYELIDEETFEKIPMKEFKEMPLDKIMTMMILTIPGQGTTVRLKLNKIGLKKNPAFDTVSEMEVMAQYRQFLQFMKQSGRIQ